MPVSNKYIGCRLYIYDESGKKIAESTISDYDSKIKTISLKSTPQLAALLGIVNILIVAIDGIYEYKGRLRRSSVEAMNLEITLFGGKKKENRTAKRYPVKMKCIVENMIINRLPVAMLTPLEVFTVNLSTSGALIKTVPNCFNLNSLFELKLTIDGGTTYLPSEIVWVKDIDNATSEYGCKFV